MHQLEQKSAKQKIELDQLTELRESVLLNQEQVLMQREDYDAWLMREKE